MNNKSSYTDKKSLSELFFSSQRSPLSDISNNSVNEDYLDQLQYIQILEKKLKEQQQLNQSQNEQIVLLNTDIQKAKQTIQTTEQQLDNFYSDLKNKEQLVQDLSSSLRNEQMKLANKELCQMNKTTQTEQYEIQSSQNNIEDQEHNFDIEIAQQMWMKKLQMEYQQLISKKEQLEIREKAVQFRENKIRQFMEQISKNA